MRRIGPREEAEEEEGGGEAKRARNGRSGEGEERHGLGRTVPGKENGHFYKEFCFLFVQAKRCPTRGIFIFAMSFAFHGLGKTVPGKENAHFFDEFSSSDPPARERR